MTVLPHHWGGTRLKWSCDLTAGGTPPTDDLALWLEGDDASGTPFVSISDMSRRQLINATARALSPAGIASRTMPVAGPGTLLLAMYASVGEVARLAIDATWNQALLGITPSGRLDIRFLQYSLESRRNELLAEVRSNTQSNLNAKQVANLSLPLPPLAEQRAIADYLDRETAQIDTLIEEQHQLVRFLVERKDASWDSTIAGLSMRWPTLPLRRLMSSIVDGPFGSSLSSKHYTDDGARVIRLGNIGIGVFRDHDKAFVSLEYANVLSAHEAVGGDVVVAGLGDERMPLGRAAVVPDDLGPSIVKADCYRVRPNALISSDYLAWAMSAPSTRQQIALLSRGATRARLNTAVVKNVQLPVPDRDTQARVIATSRQVAITCDRTIAETERFIELSRERRSALITAAVTGQIDVRSAA